MVNNQKRPSDDQSRLDEYAYQVIVEQFKHVTKQQKKVLKDENPEPLHQMRVGIRRLRTALQVFEMAIALPKSANNKQLRDVARVLGKVRDLDVQIASLKDEYQPKVKTREKHCIDQVIASLQKQRKKAFSKMEKTFNQPLYQEVKSAFVAWLEHPQYTAIAQLPLTSLLPDLLSPLLSHLLLHPGWLISIEDASDENALVLHDLRKALKHARYQTEFFIPCYGEDFQNWIKEVKELQERLGQFQDIQVLQALLTDQLDNLEQLSDLQKILNAKITDALSTWEQTRQKYLKDDYRYHLHQILLQPTARLEPRHLELVNN